MSKEKSRNLILEWIVPILTAIILAILINKFIIFKIQIPSESMVPTINIGDNLFVHRVYNIKNLNRGDLVVFNFEPKDELYIKRLIGLPNDTISITNGIVSVNGEILEETYVKNQSDFTGEYVVPHGEYFFLGDNRGNSTDSRFWEDPYINAKDIKGKAFIKVYPFTDMGFVK